MRSHDLTDIAIKPFVTVKCMPAHCCVPCFPRPRLPSRSVLLIASLRMAIATVPAQRTAGEGDAVLLARPATPGLAGAAQDWLRLLAGGSWPSRDALLPLSASVQACSLPTAEARRLIAVIASALPHPQQAPACCPWLSSDPSSISHPWRCWHSRRR